MANPMEALVKSASGTGAPTNPTSRYYGAAVNTITRPDGEKVAYLQRRIIPQPDVYTNLAFSQVNPQLPHTIFDGSSELIRTRIEAIPHCGQLKTFGSFLLVTLITFLRFRPIALSPALKSRYNKSLISEESFIFLN